MPNCHIHNGQEIDYNMQNTANTNNNNNRIVYISANLSIIITRPILQMLVQHKPIKKKYYRKLSFWHVRNSHTREGDHKIILQYYNHCIHDDMHVTGSLQCPVQPTKRHHHEKHRMRRSFESNKQPK